MARERLGLIKDLCRISKEQREADHFQSDMHGKELSRFADRAQDRLHHVRERKQLRKYDFQPDPVEKMSVSLLPPIRVEEDRGGGGGAGVGGEDVGKALTSKDLYKQRVQLQKTNFEQGVVERRNRRRSFWDKAVIGTRKKELEKYSNGIFRQRAKMFGSHPLVQPAWQEPKKEEEEGEGEGEEEVKEEVERLENGEADAAAEDNAAADATDDGVDDDDVRKPRGLCKSLQSACPQQGQTGSCRQASRPHPPLSQQQAQRFHGLLPVIEAPGGSMAC